LSGDIGDTGGASPHQIKSPNMRILIATVRVPFVDGGAENLAEGLCDALLQAGHQAEVLAIPFKWYPAERILDHMLACRLLDLTESSCVPIDLVIGLKFPAYLVPVDHKVLWLLHQHRQAYDQWGKEIGDLDKASNGLQVRSAIREADSNLIPEAKAVYTIAGNVSRRLRKFNGIRSEPLYHPPKNADKFYCAADESYLYYPSRLSHSKRQSLVLHALAQTREKVVLRFAGSADGPTYGDELRETARELGVHDRVEWLGFVDEKQKRDHYARATAVVFPPYDEDYGYVTLEAMLSSKPVITCTDSGGPLEFVQHQKTGLVADPTSASLAAAFDLAWRERDRMHEYGAAGRARYDSMDISWSHVVRKLAA
jgi:glycosyltransferase involved in cell wall biosynthesis